MTPKLHTRITLPVLLGLTPAVAFAALPASPRPPYREGEVLVQYRQPQTDAREALRSRLGLTSLRRLRRGDAELLALPAMTTTAQALELLRRNPGVLHAEPNFLRYARITPNDPLFSDQWGLQNTGQANFVPGGPAGVAGSDMNMLAAWDPAGNGSFTRVGDPAVLVAIVDDAFDLEHEDLAPNLDVNAADPTDGVDQDGNGLVDDTYGWDFADGDNDPRPDDSSVQPHGTMVAGCAVARGDDGVGVAGTAWKARLLPLKVSRLQVRNRVTEAVFDSAAIVDAFDYARERGARIVNASFGGPSFSQIELDSIVALGDSGAVLVAAAGNDDSNTDLAQLNYPANLDAPNIVAVAATNRQDQIASFSQYGALTVDVAAPGLQIVTTLPNSGYSYNPPAPTTPGVSGTSFSSPYTAGIAALIASEYPSATPLEIKARLIEGAEAADDVSLRTVGGRVDAAASLDLAARPALIVRAVALNDGNGVLDPGESVSLDVTLENLWLKAANVSGTLTAGSGVTITRGTASFGTILVEGTALASFTLDITSAANEHRYVPFTLDLNADGYSARRRFLLEIGRLEGTSAVSEQFAPTDTDLYDEFHAWHVDFTGFPEGHDQLIIETTAPADIDLLVKRGTPPLYNITVGINPETDSGFFCTSATTDNCQDPEVRLSAGPDGNERVVITGATPGTYHLVIVNFAQLSQGLGYTVRAYTRKAPLVPATSSGAPAAAALGVLLLGALLRRRRP